MAALFMAALADEIWAILQFSSDCNEQFGVFNR